MNATDSTFPPTFDEYLARWVNHGIGVEDHLEEIREMYDRERLADRLHPQVDDMPPCPRWCALDYGHRYESILDLDSAAGMVTLERCHTTQRLAVESFGSVGQEEHLRDGRVSYGPLHIVAGRDLEEITAEEARRQASDAVVQMSAPANGPHAANSTHPPIGGSAANASASSSSPVTAP